MTSKPTDGQELEKLRRDAEKNLNTLIAEGLRSGPPVEVTPADWDEIRKTAKEIASELNSTD